MTRPRGSWQAVLSTMEVRRGKDADMDRSVPLVLGYSRLVGPVGSVSDGETVKGQENLETVLHRIRCLDRNCGCVFRLPLHVSPPVVGVAGGVAREDNLQVRGEYRLPVPHLTGTRGCRPKGRQEVSLPALTKIKSWLSLFNNLKEQRICRQTSKFFNNF